MDNIKCFMTTLQLGHSPTFKLYLVPATPCFMPLLPAADVHSEETQECCAHGCLVHDLTFSAILLPARLELQ